MQTGTPASPSRTAPESFQVVLVSPDGYLHSLALAEVAETVVYGLQALGLGCTFAVNRLVLPGPRAVIFGAHLLDAPDARRLPASSIIYNLEQVSPSSPWSSPTYFDLLRRCRVWDYSARNISALAQLGVSGRVAHVPVGYMPQLTRIPSSEVEDIDVLFYGSINERRAQVIDQLRQMGLNAQAVFGVYGRPRDELMSRAKVILNLHYYETSIFELVRVSYALANRKAVVAEFHGGTEIDDDMADAVELAPYPQLAASCARLVADKQARKALAERGFGRMAERDEKAYLSRALAGGRRLDGPGPRHHRRASHAEAGPRRPAPAPSTNS